MDSGYNTSTFLQRRRLCKNEGFGYHGCDHGHWYSKPPVSLQFSKSVSWNIKRKKKEHKQELNQGSKKKFFF